MPACGCQQAAGQLGQPSWWTSAPSLLPSLLPQGHSSTSAGVGPSWEDCEDERRPTLQRAARSSLGMQPPQQRFAHCPASPHTSRAQWGRGSTLRQLPGKAVAMWQLTAAALIGMDGRRTPLPPRPTTQQCAYSTPAPPFSHAHTLPQPPTTPASSQCATAPASRWLSEVCHRPTLVLG